MTRRSFLFPILLFFVFASATVTPAQVERGIGDDAPTWFVARVVDVAPFTLEYLDDWFHYRESSARMGYEFATSVNPHGVGERVERFKLGDLVAGESCYSFAGEKCPEFAVPVVYSSSPDAGMRIPPPVDVNLKKLGSKYDKRYSRKGIRIRYTPREIGIVNRLTIFRDGMVDVGGPYGGVSDKLSDSELRDLEREFFSTQTDTVTSQGSDYNYSFLQTIFGKFRHLNLEQTSSTGRAFTNQLDRLSQRMLEKAEYRITYRWRVDIKDWIHNDILPIDEASDPQYRFTHRERLSTYRPSEEFYEEAREKWNGEINRFFYLWNGDLYFFQFPECTDGTTGSFACFRAGKIRKRDGQGNFVEPYDEWPQSARTSLRAIPVDARSTPNSSRGTGIAIDKEDFKANRDFFLRLMSRGGSVREGDAVFVVVQVWFTSKRAAK